MAESKVSLDIRNTVASIRFGDGKSNPISRDCAKSISHALIDISENADPADVKYIDLAGNGETNFSIGMDLEELNECQQRARYQSDPLRYLASFIEAWSELYYRALHAETKVPIITIAKGRVLGAGLTLNVISTFSVAILNSKLVRGSGESIAVRLQAGMPEVRFGLPYPSISSPYMIKKMGYSRYLKYMIEKYQRFSMSFFEPLISGNEAVEYGFFDVAFDEIEDFGSKIQSELNESEPKDIRGILERCKTGPDQKTNVTQEYETRFAHQFGQNSLEEIRQYKDQFDETIIQETARTFANCILRDPSPLESISKTFE